MGNTKSSALSKELLEELKSNTKYTEAELCTWYQSFLKECPSGRISKQHLCVSWGAPAWHCSSHGAK
uniref:Uncharacterized protein n=1 Tax=Neolamprologus brichardi TaxID=32507 RepID=A0A3Q4GWB5_NEOBR